MRTLFTSFLLIVFSTVLFSQTNVSGNISSNTTWTKANSPYVLTGDVGIGTGATLTVEPGVTITRSSNAQLLIKGAIDAQGNRADSIYFHDVIIDESQNRQYFLSFQETDLSNSSLAYLSVDTNNPDIYDRKGTYDQRTTFLQVSFERGGYDAPVNVSGVLTVSNSSFWGNSLVVEGQNSDGKLVIRDCHIKSSIVNSSYQNSEKIEIISSYVKSSIIGSGSRTNEILISSGKYEDTQFDVEPGAKLDFEGVVLINSVVQRGASGAPIETTITVFNSKFINTQVIYPWGYFKADMSMFVVDRNVPGNSTTRPDHGYALTRDYLPYTISVGRISLNNSFINLDGGDLAINLTGLNGQDIIGNSIISNNVFINYEQLNNGFIGVRDFDELSIEGNNFYTQSTQAIVNNSSKDIDATSNFYFSRSTIESIEEIIYHFTDDRNLGIVDYSGFTNSPNYSTLISPPIATIYREVEHGNYTNNVGLKLNHVDPKADKFRVYSTKESDLLDTTLIAEFLDLDQISSLPILSSGVYAVSNLDVSGNESWLSLPSNAKPIFFPQISSASVNENNSGRMTFKILDKERDVIKVSASIDENTTSLVQNSGIQVNQLKTDGDTTFYQVILTPRENSHGQLDELKIQIEDGLNQVDAVLGPFVVLPIDEYNDKLIDTLAYVGDSIGVVLDIYDLEEGQNLEVITDGKPDWLDFNLIQGFKEKISMKSQISQLQVENGKMSVLQSPANLAQDESGNIYIADELLNSIFRLDNNGDLTLYAGSLRAGSADGTANEAQFHFPSGIVVASDGTLYVADQYNNKIRAVSPYGQVTTIAGSGERGTIDGIGSMAAFNNPKSLALSDDGKLYISDGTNVRLLDPETKVVSTVPINMGQENSIYSMNLARNGDILIGSFSQLFRFSLEGVLLRSYGSGSYGSQDGPASSASMTGIRGIVEDEEGNLLIADQNGNTLRKITPEDQVITIAQLEFQNYGNPIIKDGFPIFVDKLKAVLERVKMDQYIISGIPSIEDIGQTTWQIKVKDSEDLESVFDFSIDVRSNDRPDVMGKDELLLIGENDEVGDVPKFEILDSENKSFIVSITQQNGTTVQLGTSSTDLIAFQADNHEWEIEGSAAELNLLLDNLKVFSDSFEDEVLKFSFRESDGELSVSYQVLVISRPVNEEPVFVETKYIEAIVGEPFEFEFTTTDPDNEPLTYLSENWPDWVNADSVKMLQSYFDPVYSDNLPDSIQSKIISPTGITVNSDGEAFIYSTSTSQIFKLNYIGEFEVFAGNGATGFANGPRLEAQFERPRNLLFDQDDNLIVSELYNGALRKIDVNGNVSTLVGQGRILSPFTFEGQDGYSDTAKPFWIDEMVMDDKGNIYTSEYYSVGKYNATTGYYQTIAGKPGYNFDQVALDGSALDARFLYVNEAIAIKEDSLLIFDDYQRTIKTLAHGKVETVSGGDGFGYLDGKIEDSKYGGFSATLLLRSGKVLVYDDGNHVLRELDFVNDKVTSIAGLGYSGVSYGVASQSALGVVSFLHELDNGDVYVFGDKEIKLLSPSVPKISGTPAIDDIGENKFTLRVSDGHGGIITEEITINVLPPNMTPEVTEIPSQEETYAQDGQFDVSLFDYFNDAETSDEELVYEVVSIDDEIVVTADVISSTDGILSLTIQGAGEANVAVKVTDVGGKSVTTTFAVTIAKAEAEIAISAAEEIEEDGLSKEVTVSTSPSGLNYTITYNGDTEAPTVAGTYSVVVTIDEANYSGVAEYELVILPFNAVPEVTEIPLQEETYAPESQFEVSLFNYFSDVETSDEELTYEVISIDSETVVTAESISSTNGILSLNILGAGEANVTLKATDVRGKSVTTTFAVSIAKAEAEIDLGELEFINDEAEKPLAITTVPSGLNYTLTYDEESTVPSTVGEYAVKVVIDEANYQGEATGTLKVLNIVPEDIQISSLTVLENSASATIIGSLSVTDQNSTDTHTYELEAGVADNDSFELSGSNLVVKDVLDFEQQSSYSITVTVTDNYGASYSKSFSVSVTDVNEVPTIDEVEGIEIVQNLGELGLTITGLSAGEETSQTIELSSSVSGVVESASISLNSDNESATLNFQTIQDQTGAGTIVLTVKDNGGIANGGVDTKTITIPVAVLSSNITVNDEGSCGPGSVSLSATGADDYNWYTSPIGGTSFATGGSREVNVTETTTYFVAGIFSGTQSKLRIPVTASLYSMPDVPIVTNNQGVLTTSEASGITYQWILDGEEVEGATSSSFEPILSGQYSLRATNANGCSVTSESIEVVLAGVEDNYEEISAKIYPVPATDVLELEFEETLQKGTTIKLMSNTGAEFSQTTLQQATRQVSLDVSYLPEGTHIVFVRSRNKLLRKKFIIAR